MRRTLLVVFALLPVVLLADGAAFAQPSPEAAESSEPTPEDGVIIAVGTRLANGTGVVRLLADRDNNETFETRIDEFAPYSGPAAGGVRVAMGDFDGDGNDELVTATGGNTPVKVFDLTSDGHRGAQLMSHGGFPQGAQIAAGDINADGRDELVTAADRGSSKVEVRADSNDTGVPSTLVETFTAFPQARGVRVALGDLDNVVGAELATSQGPGTVGRVRVWNDTDNDLQFFDNPLVDNFLPFDATFKSGTSIAIAVPDEATATNADQILVAPESGKKRLRRFSDEDNDGDFGDDGAIEQFFPYGNTFGGGIRMAAGDVDISGLFQELVVVPATPAGARPMRIIDDNGADPTVYGTGTQLDSRVVFQNTGQFVAVGRQVADSYTTDDTPLAIPDATTVTLDIVVPASAGIVRDLDTFLAISHTFNGDLDVSLEHLASGTTVTLFTDIGGTDEGLFWLLDDEAGTDLSLADNPTDGASSGSFNPEGAALLSAFDGIDASGRWRLTVTDDTLAGADVGTVRAWELHFSV